MHMVGIPACFVAAPIALIFQQWWWALGFFVGGYILQFIGHAVEGSRLIVAEVDVLGSTALIALTVTICGAAIMAGAL